MKISIYLSLCSAFLMLLISCTSYASKKVKFVFPEEFRGSVRLIMSDNGIELSHDSNYIFLKIPLSGTLRIKNKELFLKPTQVEAEYINGKKIPVEIFDTKGESANPEDFLLRTSYSTEGCEGQGMWWTLGTLEDVKKTKLKMMFGDKVTSTSEIPNSPPL